MLLTENCGEGKYFVDGVRFDGLLCPELDKQFDFH
jgi:hypothetical protein